MINVRCVQDGHIDLSTCNAADVELATGKWKHFQVEEGDILFTISGSIGRTAIVQREHLPLLMNTSVVRFRPTTPRLTDRFFYYYLQSWGFLSRLHALSSGSAQKNVGPTHIKTLDVPLPPLAEQQRIVGILDEAFAGIATAKANAEKNRRNARAIFDSELDAVFAQPNSSWIQKPLQDVGATQTGSTPKTSDAANYGDFIPFVKPADFRTNGTVDYDNDGLSQKGLALARVIPANSVLMVCIGATIGKCGFCERDITTNQQINAFIPNGSVFYRFIYYQMLTETFQNRVLHGSGQATLPIINKGKWSALPVWLAKTIDEQKQIAARFDGLCREVERLESLYQQKLAALDALKKSLLHQAFSGKLATMKEGTDRELVKA